MLRLIALYATQKGDRFRKIPLPVTTPFDSGRCSPRRSARHDLQHTCSPQARDEQKDRAPLQGRKGSELYQSTATRRDGRGRNASGAHGGAETAWRRYIPAPSNRSPPATFKSAKATGGDLLEGAGIKVHKGSHLWKIVHHLEARQSRQGGVSLRSFWLKEASPQVARASGPWVIGI